MQENPYAAPSVDPNPSPQNSGASDGPREWSLGAAFGIGWEAMKKNPGVLVGGFFLVMVLQQIIQSVVQQLVLGTVEQSTDPIEVLKATALTTPITAVFGVYLGIGQFRVAVAAARGEELEMGMFFSGFNRLLSGIILMVLLYAGIFLGLIVFVIPGLIIAMGWSLAFCSLADTDMSPKEALSDSWANTKGQKMRLLVFGFAACGVFLLGILALGVGIFVAYPVVMVAFAEIYMCITGRRTAQS